MVKKERGAFSTRRGLIPGILTVLALTLPVAAETRWQVAPERSSVSFKVAHLVFLDVEGMFRSFDATVTAGGEDLQGAVVEARIRADSIYTGLEDRDRDLLKADFFDADRYPEIVFRSRSVVTAGKEGHYLVEGDLTIRDVTLPVRLEARCRKRRDLPDGRTRLDFTATGLVNRFDYGLRWNELMETGGAIVGQNVEITLDIALLEDRRTTSEERLTSRETIPVDPARDPAQAADGEARLGRQ